MASLSVSIKLTKLAVVAILKTQPSAPQQHGIGNLAQLSSEAFIVPWMSHASRDAMCICSICVNTDQDSFLSDSRLSRGQHVVVHVNPTSLKFPVLFISAIIVVQACFTGRSNWTQRTKLHKTGEVY